MRLISKQINIKNFYWIILEISYLIFFFNLIFNKKFINFIKLYFIKNTMYYFTFSKINYFFLINLILNFINFINFFLKFYFKFYKFYKFFTFAGLGFKKRLSPIWVKSRFFMYFGDRHRIIFLIPKNLIFFHLVKRKSIVLFSLTKNLLKLFLSNFKSFCRENFFKLKGVLDVRLKKRWVFMRRIKLRGMKVKLSKKQKIL